MRTPCILIAFLATLAVVPGSLIAQELPRCPAGSLVAEDTPGDAGRSITLSWQGTGEENLLIMRSTSRREGFEVVGDAMVSDEAYTDLSVEDDTDYYYRLGCKAREDTVYSNTAGPVDIRTERDR
jgi:hypothetical protein